LQGFAKRLKADHNAVRADVALAWSNGQTEGQVNRLKTLKRQMYRRASLDLLGRRFLLAFCSSRVAKNRKMDVRGGSCWVPGGSRGATCPSPSVTVPSCRARSAMKPVVSAAMAANCSPEVSGGGIGRPPRPQRRRTGGHAVQAWRHQADRPHGAPVTASG